MRVDRLADNLERLAAGLRNRQRPAVSRRVSLEEWNAAQLDFVAPIFVLSTGRCGTRWLTELLNQSKQVKVNHSDYPELIRHSRLAYERYEQTPQVFQEIIRATRDEFILDAYQRGQIYVETNNRITFFAYAIKQVYPNARFIHLVRHPGDFVRSGLNRHWYESQTRHEAGRIVKSDPVGDWPMMGAVEKIAWLWNETNQYIETFLAALPPADYEQVKVETMFSDLAVALNLCRFIGVDDVTPGQASRLLRQTINTQREQSVAPYQTWPEDQKIQVRRQAELAARYFYQL